MKPMATQISPPSQAIRVLERIDEERFTGLLRVSAREATGEFWFLAGILEEGRFGASRGEEARERLLRATEVTFQAELRLPHVSGGLKKPMPASGSFAEFRPVVLMRHCESYALTCSLELRGTDRTVRLTYRVGDLLSVDAAAGNDALPALLESDQGTFEFSLPTFELPEGTVAMPSNYPSQIPLAERIDRVLADEAAAAPAKPAPDDASEAQRKFDEAAVAAEAKRKADEAAAVEAKRKADEAAAAEAKRKADEAAAAEAKRKADEAAAAEAKRKAEQVAAEARRRADEAAAAAARRKADEAAAAETKRQMDEAAAAEAKRQADEAAAAEAKRQADEAAAAEAKRQADEAAAAEAKREADEAAAAEAKREADEAAAAEAKRQADDAAVADAKRTDEARAVAASKIARESKRGKAPPEAKRAGSSKPKTSPSKSSKPDDEQLRVPTRTSRWPLLLLALVLVGLAYFMMVRMGYL
jgi:hypothetical protein